MPRSEETVPLLEFLPLNDVPNVILNRICQVLWRWEDCLGCESEADCGCHRKRDEEFGPFDKFYKTVTFWSGAEICGDGPALRNHDDLLKIISVIKANPSSPKKSLVVEFFADYGEAMPGDKDQQRAFNLALTVMTMARCSLKGPVCRDWPRGFAPVDWGMGDSALDFIKMAIPQVEPLRMGTTDGLLGVSELMASHLEDCGMTLEGTSDLRRHLYFDTTSGTLYIFHYAGFLKAWLKETRGVPNQTLILPRKLLLETLHSLQQILFPAHDPSSRQLVEKKDWDPGCVGFDLAAYVGDDEDMDTYRYWGSRWCVLAQEIKRRKRRWNWFWAWLDEWSGRPHVMLATVVSVVLTAAFGAGSIVATVMKG